jgi:hypothetical protein
VLPLFGAGRGVNRVRPVLVVKYMIFVHDERARPKTHLFALPCVQRRPQTSRRDSIEWRAFAYKRTLDLSQSSAEARAGHDAARL